MKKKPAITPPSSVDLDRAIALLEGYGDGSECGVYSVAQIAACQAVALYLNRLHPPVYEEVKVQQYKGRA